MPDEFCDVASRQPDDFCPRAQLKKFVEACGNPEIGTKTDEVNSQVTLFDTNLTYKKISEGMAEFVKTYAGPQQESAAKREADKIYLRKLKSLSTKSAVVKSYLESAQYHSVKTTDLKMKIVKSSMVKSLPWNGWADGTEMTNTCTVDNLLFFSHMLQCERVDLADEFKNRNYQSYQMLNAVHNRFAENKFSIGKKIWLGQFFDEESTTWDSYGSEQDISFCKLPVANVYTSTCRKESCFQPVLLFTSRIIGYENNTANLNKGVNRWLENKSLTLCGRRGCDGLRTTTNRSFIDEAPPSLFAVEVMASPWATFSPHISIGNTVYMLSMVIYGSGGHFCASIKFRNQWWLYDGLKVYNCSGTGLKRQPRPIPPPRFSKNYVLYVKQ